MPTGLGLVLRLLLRRLLALALLLGAAGVAAAPSTAQVINDLYNSFLPPVRQFGAALVGSRVGVGLVGSLVALQVLAGGLAYAAGHADPLGLLLRALRLSITAALVLAAIQPQPWFAAMSGFDTLGKAVEGGFFMVARWAAQAAQLTDVSDPESLIRSVANSALMTLFKMGEIQVFPANTSMWKAMTNVTGLMAGLLIWFLCLMAYVLAGAMVLGQAVVADLTLQLALAFAPLMVPWLLFAPLRFLFEAWLKTLLVGGVGFVIATLFCAGMAAFADSAHRALLQVLSEPFVNARLVATFSPILLGAIVMIMLAGKVMALAQALLTSAGWRGLSLQGVQTALRSGMAPGALAMGAARMPSQVRVPHSARAGTAATEGLAAPAGSTQALRQGLRQRAERFKAARRRG